jgi:hypothetical protein
MTNTCVNNDLALAFLAHSLCRGLDGDAIARGDLRNHAALRKESVLYE